MASEYERHIERNRPSRLEERYYSNVGASLGMIVGLVAIIALAALLFFAWYDRTPSGPSVVTSNPNVTAPERTIPKTPVPPNTAPSMK